MYKFYKLKYIIVITFILIVASVGYAELRSLNRLKRAKNLSSNSVQMQDQKEKAVENNKLEVQSFDTSDWKTFRHDDGGFEMKYPRYYYAIPSTENSAWLKERPVFSLVLSSLPDTF